MLSVTALQLHPAKAQVAPTPKPQTNPTPVPPPPASSTYPSEEEIVEDDSASDLAEDSEETDKGTSSRTGELPASDSNPLNSAGDSLDTLIQSGINADLWQQMKGDLPCMDATTECIAQLQQMAEQENPLLQEVDTRIEEINTKIEEAKATNKKSIDLSILRPAARVFLEPTFPAQSNPTQRQPGALEKIAQIFTSPVGVINELLKAVGIPFLDKLFGGNDQNQARAIAISDLQVKLAEIQRGRAELADKVKEKVTLAVFDFDTARRDFQLSQVIAQREASRTQLSEVKYRMGNGDSVTYLGQLSSLDRNKAATWRSWASMRSQLEKIKLLVLGTPS